MASYKLTYFDIAGLGEPIRLLLSYGSIEFQDNRITHDDWPKLKQSLAINEIITDYNSKQTNLSHGLCSDPHGTPLAQLPILEVDGKTLFQSNAIVRFLAKKFDLLGSNELEAYDVDAVIETIGDLRQLLARWFWYSDPEQKAATEAETLKKAAFYLGKLEDFAAKNGGHLVAGKLTAADITLAGFAPMFSYLLGKEYLAAYPTLKSLIEKVLEVPSIKSYVEKRPVTEF